MSIMTFPVTVAATRTNPSTTGLKIDAYLDAARMLDDIDYDRSLDGVAFDEGGPRHQTRYSVRDANDAMDALHAAKGEAIAAIRRAAKAKGSSLAGFVHEGNIFQVMTGNHLADIPESWRTQEFESIVIIPLGSLVGLAVA